MVALIRLNDLFCKDGCFLVNNKVQEGGFDVASCFFFQVVAILSLLVGLRLSCRDSANECPVPLMPKRRTRECKNEPWSKLRLTRKSSSRSALSSRSSI